MCLHHKDKIDKLAVVRIIADNLLLANKFDERVYRRDHSEPGLRLNSQSMLLFVESAFIIENYQTEMDGAIIGGRGTVLPETLAEAFSKALEQLTTHPILRENIPYKTERGTGSIMITKEKHTGYLGVRGKGTLAIDQDIEPAWAPYEIWRQVAADIKTSMVDKTFENCPTGELILEIDQTVWPVASLRETLFLPRA
jgi:hypothetical protein